MTREPASPTSGGDEVIRGRIRVDARRAVEKLREHQLVDLHHYTHELARAAVASSAERIVVDYDADDVVVTWRGDPIEPGVVGRLLDHVLTEAEDAAGRRLRLLAMGVNAALGLSPAFVDLHAVDAGGACRRARWTPSDLSSEDGVELEEVTTPAGMERGSVRVHVRRRLGWDVLRRATLGGAPREVASLVAAASHLDAELVVAGEPVASAASAAVVSVPLRLERGLAEGLSARLEIARDADRSPTLAFSEQGIELVRYDLDPTPVLPNRTCGDLHLPVRVVVEAEQLPTNASRSAIRESSSLADAVVSAARVALEEAIDGLVAAWGGRGEVPVGVKVLVSPGDPALDEALGAFVSVVVVAASRGEASSDSSRKLLDLPILRDGLGRPTSYGALLESGVVRDGPIHLHRGEPLPDALSPWMRDVIMVRGGRRADAALATFEHRDAAPLVAHAMEGLERREAFLAHRPTEVAVPPSPQHVLVQAFEVKSGDFEGLVGEVALCAVPAGRTTVRIFHERRELAVQHLAPELCPLPLDIALAWDERIRVRFGFDGVEDDRALRSALWYAMQIGVEVVRRVLGDRGDDERVAGQPARTAAWVRAAVRIQHDAWAMLDLSDRHRRPIAADDPLREIPAWPTVMGRLETIASLARVVRRQSALCYVEPGTAKGSPLDERVVLIADGADRLTLADVLGHEMTWVPYERGLVGSVGRAWERRRSRALMGALDDRRRLQREAFGVEIGVRMRFERPGTRGLVALAAQAERVVLHAGETLTAGLFPRRFGPVVIVADDETVVPAPDWRGVAWSGKTWAPPSVEHELLVTVMTALEGDEAAQLALGGEVSPTSLGVVGRCYLAQSFAALEQELNEEQNAGSASELVHLSARAVELPVFRMVGENGRARWVSTGDVLDAHGTTGPIPTVSAEPDFESHDWHPLLVTGDRERAALRDWFGGRLVAADHLLSARRQRAAVETRHREVLAQPPVDPFSLGNLAPADSQLGRYEEDGVGSACVGMGPPGMTAAPVDVAFRLRPVLRDGWHAYPLPVVARVSLESGDAFDDSLRELTSKGRSRARRLVAFAAADLVRTRLAADEEAMFDEVFLGLVAGLFGPAGPAMTLLVEDLLQRVAHWPTVQGGSCRLPEARRGRGEIYVGRARYEPWREGKRPGALDRAVVHVGTGSLGGLHGRILEALKVDRRDVSDAVEALQRRRASGEDGSSPSLSGEPAHPSLRATIDELGGARGLSGELELVDGPSRLVVGDLTGPARDVTARPTAPVRAVVWTETVASDERDGRIAKRIDRLARRLVVRVAQAARDGEALPPFVASLLRREIGDRLTAESAIEAALREAPVFVDTQGRWHSLATLDALQGRQKPIWTTSGEPPFPERADERVILRLEDGERMWLRRALPLRNMTSVLERTVAGQLRRAAEPVRELRLSQGERAACLWTGVISGDGLAGEIGWLAPAAADHRGIAVHTERRPLCHLEDRPGWPICAVVDDAEMLPNPFFDGPRQIDDGTRLVARVRERADAMIERLVVAPAAAPVSRFIDASDAARGFRVKGCLWLETDPTARPSVAVYAVGARAGRSDVPLVQLKGPEGMDRTLPVSGTLLVEHASAPAEDDELIDLARLVERIGHRDAAEVPGGSAAHGYLTELAVEALAAMVDELAGRIAEADVDRLRWTLALLDVPLGEEPVARGTEGEVTASAVRDELTERQTIWITRGRGHADGGFPGTPPRFVLLTEGNEGLVAALEARSLLRELGGEASPGRARRPPRRQARPSDPPRRPEPVWNERVEPEETLVDPLFSGLVSTVRGWFGSAAPAPVTTTLRGALEGAIAGLQLPGEPVLLVGFSRRGRAIRYQKSSKRLVINRDHPAILSLVPAEGEMSDPGRRLLLAAIVSELNRVHEAVTAAAELEALRYLLELPSR